MTIDIPADMGTGQILQVVTKQGAVVADWKMNYFSDMNVQGVSCEDSIQLLFCFNDGVSWNIADARQCRHGEHPPFLFLSRVLSRFVRLLFGRRHGEEIGRAHV